MEVKEEGQPMSKIDRSKGVKDPSNQINYVKLKKGKVTGFLTGQIPWYAFSRETFALKVRNNERRIKRRDKIHPTLKRMLLKKEGKLGKQQIIISFRDNLTIPRFPELDPRESVRSRANRFILNDSKNLVNEIIGRRENSYEKLLKRNLAGIDSKVLRKYWLINAVLVEVKLSRKNISTLAKREDCTLYFTKVFRRETSS